MAESLYRKYRPQVFEDVVGQENITRTLRNAVREGKVGHAYLFCGPRGTGKTTTARLLAKALLCEHGPTDSPCGTCQACVDIANGTHPDVYELDAASRTGVDNVRDEIISRVNFAPTRGRKKIYIIDEVHMLSTAAFNALLKTLEEPPEHVVFILCTTDPQKVPPTIQSRCQRFDFHRISDDEIVQRLGYVCAKEKIEYEPEALGLIAQHAQGGMRNALTSLEQLSAFGEGKITLDDAQTMLGTVGTGDMSQIMEAIGTRDAAACFTWVANYVDKGADLAQFAEDLAWHVRNAYILSLAGTDAIVDIDDAERSEIVSELKMFGPDRLARLLGVLGDLIAQLKTSTNPRLCFEIALTRMIRPDSDLTLASLAERIETLERAQHNVRNASQPTAEKPHVQQTQAAPASPSRAVPAPRPASMPNAQPNVAPAPMPNARPSVPPVAMPNAQRPQASVPPVAMPNAQRPQASVPQQPVPQQPTPVAQRNIAQQSVPAVSQQAPSAVQHMQTEQQSSQNRNITPEQRAALQKIIGNPVSLQRAWQEALAQVKKRKMPLGVMLIGVKPVANNQSDGIVLQFPSHAVLARKAVQTQPENQTILREELEKKFGQGIIFTCINVSEAMSATDPFAAQNPVQPQSASVAPQQQPARPPISQPSQQTPRPPMPQASHMPSTAPRPQPAQPQQPETRQPTATSSSQPAARQPMPSQTPQPAPRPMASKPQQGQAPQNASSAVSQPSTKRAPAPAHSGSESPETPDAMGQMLSDAMGADVVFHDVTNRDQNRDAKKS